jgi:alpha-methylacyl-CoA racemase
MGPLKNIRIVEFAGIGPAPFCGMLLADLGADVVRIDRPDSQGLLGQHYDVLGRGKRSVALDLKQADQHARALQLVENAHGLIEGFRPGVMEKLALGPTECLKKNPKLVYGRMTGWGQAGPLSQSAGHDINYISLSGALHAIGTNKSGPVVPLNLVGDFGGGALYLAVGMLAALLEAKDSGHGQVIDAAIVDGTSHLMSMMYSLLGNGLWNDSRGENLLDGSAPFYSVYQCKDEKWISIGPIEERFYDLFLQLIDDDIPSFAHSRSDPTAAIDLRKFLEQKFADRTQLEWINILENTDVCFAPIMNMTDAPQHPHNIARNTFITRDGITQPAPAPRFSRTEAKITGSPPELGEHNDKVFSDWGIS